jgi:hypothetical protein
MGSTNSLSSIASVVNRTNPARWVLSMLCICSNFSVGQLSYLGLRWWFFSGCYWYTQNWYISVMFCSCALSIFLATNKWLLTAKIVPGDKYCLFWTLALLKNTVFGGVMDYCLVDIYQCFGGVHCILFLGKRASASQEGHWVKQLRFLDM